MFNNPKYLTKGVQDTIPIWLIRLMWFMVAAMEVSQQDYPVSYTHLTLPTILLV